MSSYMSVLSVIFALSLIASSATGEPLKEQVKRFELFDKCRPMRLSVENLHGDASKIGLTKKSIQAAAESRLRSARLYRSGIIRQGAEHELYINVNIVRRAYSVSLEFRKLVRDLSSNLVNLAPTWEIGGAGTHAGNAGNILSFVAQLMDKFLVEYLRVNEQACQKR